MVTLNPGDNFRLQAESTPEPVLAVDNQMRLVVFNSAAEAFLGYDRQQVLGRHLNSLLIGGFGPISLAKLQEAVASGREGQVGEAHVSARHNQGYQMAVEASLSLLHDGEKGFHVLATLRNEDGSSEKEPRLRVIQRINHLLTEQGPWGVRFGALHEELQRLSSIQWMGLILLSPGGKRARVHNSHASYRNSRVTTGQDLALDQWMEETLIGGQRVLRRIQPRGGHALERQLYLDGLRQLMVLPMTHGDRIAGALALGSMQAEGLNEEQTGIVEQLIPQLTIALDQELTQDRLAASQRHYQTLLDNLHEAVFRADASGRLEFANATMARLMDCPDSHSLLAGKATLPFLDPQAGRELLATLEREGKVSDLRVQLVNCQGQPTTFNLTARMVYDGEGLPQVIEGTLQDLTEQERLNHALAESEALFNKVLTDSAECILLADEDGLIREVNRAAMDLLGLTRSQLIGRPIDKILEQCRDDSAREPSRTERGQTIEVFTREGERVEVYQNEPIRGEPDPSAHESNPPVRKSDQLAREFQTPDDGSPDHTSEAMDRRVVGLRERLSAHREGLANSEQLTELGHLVASIAREINDPQTLREPDRGSPVDIRAQLQAINGLIDQYEQLADRVEQTPELEDLVESLRHMRTLGTGDRFDGGGEVDQPPIEMDLQVDQAVEHGADISLSTPKIPETPITIAAVDLNQEVESNLKLMEKELRSRATVIYEPGQLPEVACDPDQVGQVLMNLLLNAIQSMDRMGTIRVTTRVDGDMAVVDIIDDGVGLSRRELERIFDAFYTTRDEANGLGLTISRRIIEAHGGQIQVSSKASAGSTFSVHLPLSKRSNGH